MRPLGHACGTVAWRKVHPHGRENREVAEAPRAGQYSSNGEFRHAQAAKEG
jgi:hypothetical protein